MEDEFDSFIEPVFRSIREAPRRVSIREPDENTAKYEINDKVQVWKKTIEKDPGKNGRLILKNLILKRGKRL